MVRNGVGWRVFGITYYWSNTTLLAVSSPSVLAPAPGETCTSVQPSEGLVTLDLVMAAGVMLRHRGRGACVCFVLLMNGSTRVRHYNPQLKR